MKKITVRQPDEQARSTTAADDWVSGGTTSRPTRPTAAKGEKLARLTIDLPQELHARFKVACAQQRTKMKDEVLNFIEQWTQKHS